jgi:hypothetical protein
VVRRPTGLAEAALGNSGIVELGSSSEYWGFQTLSSSVACLVVTIPVFVLRALASSSSNLAYVSPLNYLLTESQGMETLSV